MNTEPQEQQGEIMPPEQINKVRTDVPDEEVKSNAERYCAQAVELGATAAQAVRAEHVPVDDRVALKCRIPKCFGYGTSAHCLFNSLTPDETRKVLKQYCWGVVSVIRMSVFLDNYGKNFFNLFW